jgi:hypothetical protein
MFLEQVRRDEGDIEEKESSNENGKENSRYEEKLSMELEVGV